MDNNMNPAPVNLQSLYGISPCPGGDCTPPNLPTVVNPNIPTLEELAGYNLAIAQMRAQERERERQQMMGQQAGITPGTIQPTTTQPGATGAAGTTPSTQVGMRGGVNTQSPPLEALSTGGASPSTLAGVGTQGDLSPITPMTQPAPITADSLQYMNGFMRTQIGRNVRVQFLIGTNTMVERVGVLLAVGANYILLNEVETDDVLACDYYSIKFVQFFY